MNIIERKRLVRKLVKILLTGGPSSGKSTAKEYIKKCFNTERTAVVFVNETATELMDAGLNHRRSIDNLTFQKALITLQRSKEEIYKKTAEDINKDIVLMVCDRGRLDGKAFSTEDEWNTVKETCNINEEDELNEYDAVFHLETPVVNGYTISTNQYRTETPKEAYKRDRLLREVYKNHPNRYVIPSNPTINGKMQELIADIYGLETAE